MPGGRQHHAQEEQHAHDRSTCLVGEAALKPGGTECPRGAGCPREEHAEGAACPEE
jgi:hypothetical protein